MSSPGAGAVAGGLGFLLDTAVKSAVSHLATSDPHYNQVDGVLTSVLTINQSGL